MHLGLQKTLSMPQRIFSQKGMHLIRFYSETLCIPQRQLVRLLRRNHILLYMVRSKSENELESREKKEKQIYCLNGLGFLGFESSPFPFSSNSQTYSKPALSRIIQTHFWFLTLIYFKITSVSHFLKCDIPYNENVIPLFENLSLSKSFKLKKNENITQERLQRILIGQVKNLLYHSLLINNSQTKEKFE